MSKVGKFKSGEKKLKKNYKDYTAASNREKLFIAIRSSTRRLPNVSESCSELMTADYPSM